MKGYELIKAIQENKIDSDVKFKVTNTDKTLDTIVRFDGVDIVYYDSGISIFDKWFLTTILDSDFEIIEENKEIEELGFIEETVEYCDGTGYTNTEPASAIDMHKKINELVREVNKMNKEREEK